MSRQEGAFFKPSSSRLFVRPPAMSIRMSHAVLSQVICGTVLLSTITAALAQSTTPAPHTFVVSGKQFLLDGRPYQVISGEMHYPRVPRPYWRDRFRKARAMGLNTITTYVFWNVHEPRPGVFDFNGQNDVAEYIREAQQEGLNVILRPGPTSAQSGSWEAFLRGCSKIATWCCEAVSQSILPQCKRGSCGSVKRLRLCC